VDGVSSPECERKANEMVAQAGAAVLAGEPAPEMPNRKIEARLCETAPEAVKRIWSRKPGGPPPELR